MNNVVPIGTTPAVADVRALRQRLANKIELQARRRLAIDAKIVQMECIYQRHQNEIDNLQAQVDAAMAALPGPRPGSEKQR